LRFSQRRHSRLALAPRGAASFLKQNSSQFFSFGEQARYRGLPYRRYNLAVFGRRVEIFKAFGFPINLDPSWFFIANRE
jgi:hypothetical protein